MTTTLSTLRTRVLYFLRDPDQNTYDNTEIDICINDAQIEVASFLAKQEGDMLLREAYTPMVQGTVDYAYPNTIFGRNIRALYAYDPSASPILYYKVGRGTLEEVLEEGGTQIAYPYKYTCLDGYFKIGPPPDDSGYNLKIAFIRQPTALTNANDEMDMDDEFDELVACCAAIRILETRGGKESVELLYQRRENLMMEAARLVMKEDTIESRLAWKY